jgi:hypothetical protein
VDEVTPYNLPKEAGGEEGAVKKNPDIMNYIVIPQKAPDLMDFLGNL